MPWKKKAIEYILGIRKKGSDSMTLRCWVRVQGFHQFDLQVSGERAVILPVFLNLVEFFGV
jgi:hypothetical protein